MRKLILALVIVALVAVAGYALVRAFTNQEKVGGEAVVLPIDTPGATEVPTLKATPTPEATEVPTQVAKATPEVTEVVVQEATPVEEESGGDVTSSNPLEGVKFYVDPLSNAKRQADEWRATRPDDAKAMDKIAGQPQAVWMGGWSGDIETAVSASVKEAAGDGSMPVLVAYNIPQRDCGSYSAGGVGSEEEYREWIEGFARGIGANRAVVILEPDGLPLMDCLSEEDKERRMALLSEAVGIFKANDGTVVYIDAGHSHWDGAESIAPRLKKAGIEEADGFSLNISNYYLTDDIATFGRELSGLVDGKHFVIDTSRNGLGPLEGNDPEGWCNPPGRALGSAPTTETGDPLIDAYLWIKKPGESDGTCKGGPAAGNWWAEYALGLAQRSK